MSNITKSEVEELKNIKKNQPVFAGDLQSSNDAKSLIEKGSVMRYEDKYVLTEKGKQLFEEFRQAARDLANTSILRK
jgi:predicted transcriptional regulator